MSAVVKKDDVSLRHMTIDAFSRVLLHGVGSSSPPIEAGHVPHYGLEFEFAHDIQHGRSTGAKRWPKEFGINSRCVCNQLRTVCEFSHDGGSGQEKQIRMTDRVIAHEMSGVDNHASNLRTRCHEFANQEECCFDVVLSQNFEQVLRVNLIGAIVKG